MNQPPDRVTLPKLADDADASAVPLGPIVQPYLLVLFSVPFYAGADGRRYIDPLWAKDLVGHTRYIHQLTLAAPLRRGPLPPGAVPLDQIPALRGVRCVELPDSKNLVQAVANLPKTLQILSRECDKAHLVHTGVAGWPLPEAWLLAPLLRRRRSVVLYINVESAFWRLTPGQPASCRKRLKSHLTERLNRRCVRSAQLSTFTQASYRDSLLGRGVARGHVVEASWIDAKNILSPVEAEQAARVRSAERNLKLVFVGRLSVAKGFQLLLDAVLPLMQAGAPIELDIYGAGPLMQPCAALAAAMKLGSALRLHGQVPYDETFFLALRRSHVLVAPTLSDEQPRIVYDAYSQGLPVLASDTPGMRQCIDAGQTGIFFRSGDVAALRDAVVAAESDREGLARMRTFALLRAAGLTHDHMHLLRWRLLVDNFPALARP